MQYGVTIKLSKSLWGATELKLVGFNYVAGEGVTSSPDRVEALIAMNPPRTVAEIKTWIGKTGYYRKRIRDYSAIAQPLRQIELKYKTRTKNVEEDYWSDPKYDRSVVEHRERLSERLNASRSDDDWWHTVKLHAGAADKRSSAVPSAEELAAFFAEKLSL